MVNWDNITRRVGGATKTGLSSTYTISKRAGKASLPYLKRAAVFSGAQAKRAGRASGRYAKKKACQQCKKHCR